MKNIFLLVIFSLLITACTEHKSSVQVIKKSLVGNPNSKDLLLISSLKNHESGAHIEFQEDLYITSDNFIRNQSEKFVDNETGFFKLWSEVFNFFESDIKRNARWKNRIEKYFRATDYASHIKEKQNNYSSIINLQRKELLGKLHLGKNELVIKSKDVSTINVSNDEIVKAVDKVNSLVLTEVIPEVIESLVFPVILWILGMVLGVFLLRFTKGIVFIVCLFFSIWQSIKYSNELKRHINEIFELTEKQHLTILPELQLNTTAYYNELITKIK